MFPTFLNNILCGLSWGNGVLEDIENKYCLKMSLFSGNSSKWLESVVIILYIIHYLKDR